MVRGASCAVSCLWFLGLVVAVTPEGEPLVARCALCVVLGVGCVVLGSRRARRSKNRVVCGVSSRVVCVTQCAVLGSRRLSPPTTAPPVACCAWCVVCSFRRVVIRPRRARADFGPKIDVSRHFWALLGLPGDPLGTFLDHLEDLEKCT